ncbi:MAG: M20/M25/M40 family metallo-hydrolase [Anaerolineales bacterium]|nr:M20/M25/M40 family metallo-hydrolase [Anaerolineales bacterium]
MSTEIDWGSNIVEMVDHLSRLIQADTSNPPGNEEPAVRVVKEILEGEGMTSQDFQILESAPGRVNLVARLRGDGSQRPLLLSGHLDVVPVEREHWTRDPFGGEVVDGVVWGRGALDMKGFTTMYLQAFLLARRMGLPLKRDLIFAAIADEEAGFEHGSRFLVDKHRELIDAEFGLTEAGGFSFHMGKFRLCPIQTAEKGICWLRMTASGQPGHGSMPHANNAVYYLAQAIERLRRAGHLPVHITPTFHRFVEGIAGQIGFPAGMLVGLLRSPLVLRLLLRQAPPQLKPLLVAMVSNTFTPSILKAGMKTNVIPSTAEAAIDCRTLPGQTPEDVLREMYAITGRKVTLEPVYVQAGSEFSADTPLYRLLERHTRAMDPQAIVVPFMMVGATDAKEYQRAGITMYGFTPGMLPAELPLMKMAHGHDERIPISFFESGMPVLWNVVREFCAG